VVPWGCCWQFFFAWRSGGQRDRCRVGFVATWFCARVSLSGVLSKLRTAPSPVAVDTAGSRLARDLAWNAVGNGLPLLAAVFSIPPLIHALGAARFGLLSLAWMFVGYFGLFDLGLSRALTHAVALRRGKGSVETIPTLISTAMLAIGVLAILGAATVWLLAPTVVTSLLNLPDTLVAETTNALRVLALSLPFVIVSTGLRGVLEGYQRFDIVNLVRAPLAALAYVGPLAVLPFSTSLVGLVLVLTATRVVACAVYLGACLRLIAATPTPFFSSRQLGALVTFGGWITVSNVTGPILLYLGRALIAVSVSVEAVTYFATAYDVVINLLLIPAVFVGVLFPAWSRLLPGDLGQARALYVRSLVWTFGAMLVASGAVVWFAAPALEWWIDADFAANAARVTQWIAIGVFINSFGHLSQALVQAYGRPDLTAKLHAIELIAYVPYLWWFIERFAIEGAATAWVVRVSISTLVLAVLAERCLRGTISTRDQPR
jgi:O-antigen/teichoic acid export membrane protein